MTMHPKLRLLIYNAIEKAINDSAEEQLWPHWVHDDLVCQMTDAAETVFDSSQHGQEYMIRETAIERGIG